MYIVKLSNEGDYLVRTSVNSFSTTLKKEEATDFKTLKDAELYLKAMSLKFIWPESQVVRV